MSGPVLTPEALARARAAIARLGVGPYRDGSSMAPGHLYQPLGDILPDLADVPCHRAEAVRADAQAVLADLTARGLPNKHQRGRRWGPFAHAVEIGASVGYYAWRFALAASDWRWTPETGVLWRWDAIEADPAACAVGEAVTAALPLPTGTATPAETAWTPEWYCAHATATLLRLLSCYGENTGQDGIDLVLCLNVHQWLEAQGRAAEVMAVLAAWAQAQHTVVYFQTAGVASKGLARVAYLRTGDDERDYLHAVGFAEVTWLRTTTLHGGARHLWRCDGATA